MFNEELFRALNDGTFINHEVYENMLLEYLKHTSLDILSKRFSILMKEKKLNFSLENFIMKNQNLKKALIVAKIFQDKKFFFGPALADNFTIYLNSFVLTIIKREELENVLKICGYCIAKEQEQFLIIRDRLKTSSDPERIYYHISNKDNLEKTGIVPKASKNSLENYETRIYLVSPHKLKKLDELNQELKHLSVQLNNKQIDNSSMKNNLYVIRLPENMTVYDDHSYPYGVFVLNFIPGQNIKYLGKI